MALFPLVIRTPAHKSLWHIGTLFSPLALCCPARNLLRHINSVVSSFPVCNLHSNLSQRSPFSKSPQSDLILVFFSQVWPLVPYPKEELADGDLSRHFEIVRGTSRLCLDHRVHHYCLNYRPDPISSSQINVFEK
jgi:hypothetical protein